MTWAIGMIVFGVLVFAELIFVLANSRVAPDFNYYLCRPFFLPFSMFVGSIIRIALIVAGSISLYKGIMYFLS